MLSLPEVKELAACHAEDGLRLLGLSADRDRSQLQAFLEKQDAPDWPQVFMGRGKGDMMATFHVRALPTLVLIDRAGIVRGFALSHKMLAQDLKTALEAE
jgi:hypothetical protein